MDGSDDESVSQTTVQSAV